MLASLLTEASWSEVLKEEFHKPYFMTLENFLKQEEKAHTIYPKQEALFRAYNETPFERVKVVILGQDPYHDENQAQGLAFSVPEGIAIPPSLRNIFKELHDDLRLAIPTHGNLLKWAKEGVLLLNSTLSVQAHKAASHKNRGWEHFSDATIRALSQNRSHLVFILWGRPAQSKKSLIDTNTHLILEAPHPSPLSAYRGFFGSKPFSKANTYLEKHLKSPIDWSL